MKKNKIISLFLFILMLIPLMTGCFQQLKPSEDEKYQISYSHTIDLAVFGRKAFKSIPVTPNYISLDRFTKVILTSDIEMQKEFNIVDETILAEYDYSSFDNLYGNYSHYYTYETEQTKYRFGIYPHSGVVFSFDKKVEVDKKQIKIDHADEAIAKAGYFVKELSGVDVGLYAKTVEYVNGNSLVEPHYSVSFEKKIDGNITILYDTVSVELYLDGSLKYYNPGAKLGKMSTDIDHGFDLEQLQAKLYALMDESYGDCKKHYAKVSYCTDSIRINVLSDGTFSLGWTVTVYLENAEGYVTRDFVNFSISKI